MFIRPKNGATGCDPWSFGRRKNLRPGAEADLIAGFHGGAQLKSLLPGGGAHAALHADVEGDHRGQASGHF